MQELRRRLGLMDATMINVGVMIGSGIFFTPALIAKGIDDPRLYLAVWLGGGLLSLCGALALSELSAAMPQAGGQFVYLKEIYGPSWGFLYGWASFTVINTAAIAAIAVAFATYAAPWLPPFPSAEPIVAIAVIIILTVLNVGGVRWGAWIQNTFGFAKIGALLALVVVCLAFTPTAATPAVKLTTDPWSTIQVLGAAMVAVLWSYDGWIETTYTASEVRHPERNLPRALLLSTLAVTVLYLLVNLGYVQALGMSGIRQSERVAADAAAVALGSTGADMVIVAVLISTFGATNGFILGAARVYYGMGASGLFFKAFGTPHRRFNTPSLALWCQMVWAIVLVLTGTFEQLITYVVFASWVFYGLCAVGVLILRHRAPQTTRPFSAWGYPWTPIIFALFAAILVLDTIRADPMAGLIGAGLVLTGLPVYALWQRLRL